MATLRNRWVNTDGYSLSRYGGNLVRAHEGVHEAAAGAVRAQVPVGARIIELGAGDGAFSSRLADLGYDVVAVDLAEPERPDRRVRWVSRDLNDNFSRALRTRPFNAVCLVEVIEHVENPWHLLREARQLVGDDGILLITTPNTASFLSRLLFLLRGRFHQFDLPDLEYGHISPLSPYEIRLIAGRAGWTVLEQRPAGYLPVVDLERLTLKALLWNIMRLGAWFASRSEPREGWASLTVCAAARE